MASPIEGAVLHMEGDVDGDGSTEHGIFELRRDAKISLGTTTDWVVGSSSKTISAVQELFEHTTGEDLLPGEGKRQQIYWDIGSGQHYCQIDCKTTPNDDLQWGNTGNGGEPTATDATGADPASQISVIDRYHQMSTPDSLGGAWLEVGLYHDRADAAYGSIPVVIAQPEFTFDVEQESSVAQIQLRCIEAMDLQRPVDAVFQEAF